MPLQRLLRKLFSVSEHDEAPIGHEAPTEDDMQEDEAPALPPPIRAEVIRVRHDMSPVTLEDVTAITFRMEDGQERTLPTKGEGGDHVHPGDGGLLTYAGSVLISFEKDAGDIIGGLYYIPAQEDESHE